MTNRHWSDCSLSRMPAYAPGWCTCGGYGRVTFWQKLNDYLHARWLYHTGRA
jgi:hypothetical protein